MGKTSPYTGTGKKANKAVDKARKFAAEEYVSESKHDRANKRSAKHDVRQIAKGKHLPETDIKKLTKQYQDAYKGTQGMFEDQTNEALHQFQTRIAPSVSQQFGGSELGGSSAMRQALAAAGVDLQRSITSDYANMRHGIASGTMNQANQNTLSGLNARLQANQLTMGNPITPINQGPVNAYNQKQGGTSGIGGQLIGGGLGALGAYAGSEAGAASLAALFASSKDIKENIEPYDKGLEIVRQLEVMNYDYMIPIEGRQQNRVGLIAENVPEELQGMIGDIKAVDVYGLVSLLVNCVKQLDQKVKLLEAA